MLLVTHWVLLFYGLGVGGFALAGKRIIERRFGSISLLLGSGYTLPVSYKRLFFIFYIKDTLYYVIFTILPMILGLALASLFVSISNSSLLYLFVSLSLSFLLGISFSVLLFTVMVRRTGATLIIMAAGGIYLGFSGIDISSFFIKEVPAPIHASCDTNQVDSFCKPYPYRGCTLSCGSGVYER